jgi:hypothetical protein
MDCKIQRLSLVTLWWTMEWISLSGLTLAIMLTRHNPELWIMVLIFVLASGLLLMIGIAWCRGVLGKYIRVSWQSDPLTIKKIKFLLGLCLIVCIIAGVFALLAITITHLAQIPDNVWKMGLIGLAITCWGASSILTLGLWKLRKTCQ